MFCKHCFFWSVLSMGLTEAILTCLKQGHVSVSTLQMLPTVTLKESEEMRGKAASQGCFPGMQPHWYCSLDYR